MVKERSGRINTDPLEAMAIGSELHLQFMHYHPVLPDGSGPIDQWDHFGSGLLSIGIKTADAFSIEGSGVLVGPGLGLAARHVFEPYLAEMAQGLAVPYAISVMPEGLLIWKLHQFLSGDSDVAILRLELCSNLPKDGLQLASLTTRMPSLGEKVMFVGTRNKGSNTLETPSHIEVRVGIGEVIEVHASGRDRVMLPGPCFGVKCLTMGGMSGGPVFDSNGNLVGTLTSSFEDEQGPSYASLWWPASGYEIGTIWPPRISELPTNLLALSRIGAVSIDKPEAISLDYRDGRKDIHYRPWS